MTKRFFDYLITEKKMKIAKKLITMITYRAVCVIQCAVVIVCVGVPLSGTGYIGMTQGSGRNHVS